MAPRRFRNQNQKYKPITPNDIAIGASLCTIGGLTIGVAGTIAGGWGIFAGPATLAACNVGNIGVQLATHPRNQNLIDKAPPSPPQQEHPPVRDIPEISRNPDILYENDKDPFASIGPGNVTVRVIPPQQKRIPIVFPPRRLLKDELGEQSGTETAKSKVTTIYQATTSIPFGRILHDPISESPLVVYNCDDAQWAEAFNQRQEALREKFVNWLMANLNESGQLVVENSNGTLQVIEEDKIINRLIDLGFIFIGSKSAPGEPLRNIVMFGIGEIGEWTGRAVEHQIRGLFDVRSTIPSGIEVVDCNVPFAPPDDSPDLPIDVCNPCNYDGDSCFVPIRNFRQDDFSGIGYKTQLQIVFDNNQGQPTKHLSIPAPKDDLTAQEIANVVGSSRDFGHTKYEADCTPYGYLRYHGPANQEEAVKDWFEALMTLSTGSIKPETFRSSYKKRPYTKGTFKTARAYVFAWTPDEAEPTCKRFALKPLFS